MGSDLFIRMVRLLAIGVMIASAASPLQAQTAGSIAGQVLDKEVGEPLVGAEVRVEGTSLVAVTDRSGRFRLAGVTPGEHVIIVTFLGFAEQKSRVTVSAGATTEHNVTLTLTIAEEVVVTATLLEGQARALNQQRTASNMMSVVSADQISGFPDPNVGEAAQRVPGVILQRDDGEGELIILRGINPRLNSVALNGERIPSTEPQDRSVNFISVPTDILQGIEVSKTLRPDMDVDAIGGTVNFVTKQAPEQPMLLGSFEIGYNELRNKTNPKGSVTAGRRFASKRVGLIGSASAQDENRSNQTFESTYLGPALEELTLRDEIANYQRYSGNGAADWITPSSTLYVRSTFTRQDQSKVRRRDRYDRLTRSAAGGGRFRVDLRDRERQRDIWASSVGGTALLAPNATLDYQVAFNRAHREEPGTFLNTFTQTGVRYAPSVNGFNVQANPQNADRSQARFTNVQIESLETEDRDWVGQANLALTFSGARPGQIKVGVKYRDKRKLNDQNATEFTGSSVPNLSVVAIDPGSSPFLNGQYSSGPYVPVATLHSFIGQYNLTGRQLVDRNSFDYTANEDVLAGYGMLEVNLSRRLLILAGARYEYTRSSYDATRRTGTTIVPVEGESRYGTLAPMVHLRYAVNDRTNVRAAVTRSLARPNFYDLVPYSVINTDADTIDRGNPDLNVTAATNVDAMVERYFSSVGVLGAGIFFKRLEDPIVPSRFLETVDGELFTVRQPLNGTSGEVRGAEVFYQQRLSFLPRPLDGLGVYANYTYVASEATLPDRPDATVFPGQTDHSGNLAFSYEKRGFVARAAMNYVGNYLFEVGTSADSDIFKLHHTQWDLMFSQQISDAIGVYANFLNVNDANDREYYGVRSRASRMEKYSWWSAFGVRLKF